MSGGISPSDRPRLRFAPSPTGYAHIGSARTALYNYLLARSLGGDFILRIEDTDQTRLVADSVDDIARSFGALGIEWSEGPGKGGPYGPYYQSERLPIYHELLHRLVQEGHAYPCFCSKERLDEVRKAQEAAKRPPGYDRHCRDVSPLEASERMQTELYVLRFKMPLDGTTIVSDLLRGPRPFENRVYDDHVLLKRRVGDEPYAWPTYHGSSPIDDHLMRITHIVRGDEWFSSTPRHKLLFEAFGWDVPTFAHLPVILSPTGGKMSKRSGAVMTAVRDFLRAGYLPEAIVNFLLLLGWSAASEREFYSIDEAAQVFSFAGLSTSPAAFNSDKLEWFNGMYIRRLSPDDLALRITPYLVDAGYISAEPSESEMAYLMQIVPLVQERISLLGEVPEQVDFFYRPLADYDGELLIPKKTTLEDTLRVLEAAVAIIGDQSSLDAGSLHEAFSSIAEKLDLKPGQVFMPLRVALSGRTVSPGSSTDIMVVLGKERSLERLQSAVSRLVATARP